MLTPTPPSYQDEDITTEESFREACIKTGLSLEQADELIGKISGEEIKEELKKTTQEALDLGVGRGSKQNHNKATMYWV